jgi:hypothetical protein
MKEPPCPKGCGGFLRFQEAVPKQNQGFAERAASSGWASHCRRGGQGAELGKCEGIGYHNSFLKREYAFLFDIHKESPWRKT